MRHAFGLVVTALALWLAVIAGMELQAGRMRRQVSAEAIPWDAHYDERSWVNVVKKMQSSNDDGLGLAAVVAREGYRLGVASGEAACMASWVRRGRD